MNNKIFTAIALCLLTAACTKKLDRQPSNAVVATDVYSTPLGYTQAMAKVYAAFANTGNIGGTGSPDLPTQIISDEGNSPPTRPHGPGKAMQVSRASTK